MGGRAKSAEAIVCDASRRSILIVGAGYGGLRFFSESLHETIQQNNEDSLEYIFVDSRSRSQYGRGIAWASDQNPHMRTNMHIPEITADPLTGKTVAEILGISYEDQPTASQLFARREDVGNIFSEQFNQAEMLAHSHGIPVHCVEGEVIDIERHGIKYCAKLKNKKLIHTDFVVLALGHIPSTKYPHLFGCKNYVRNAWLNTDQIEEMESDAKVAVLGLGPTAVDTIIKLRDAGVSKIAAYSMSGTMQYPRPKPAKFEPKIFVESNLKKIAEGFGPLRLGTLKGLIFSEFLLQGVDWRPFLSTLEVSRKSPGEALRYGFAHCDAQADWFGLIATLTAAIPTAWHLLDDRDRDRFRSIHHDLSNVLYGMAPSHALRMLAEIDAQSLSTYGGLKEVTRELEADKFILRIVNKDLVVEHEAHYVIDCTGFGTNLTYSATPLIANMLASGYLKTFKFGGAVVDFETGQLENLSNGKSLRIFCLAGSLTIGTRFVTNGLGEVHRSAQRTARAIHKYIS